MDVHTLPSTDIVVHTSTLCDQLSAFQTWTSESVARTSRCNYHHHASLALVIGRSTKTPWLRTVLLQVATRVGSSAKKYGNEERRIYANNLLCSVFTAC